MLNDIYIKLIDFVKKNIKVAFNKKNVFIIKFKILSPDISVTVFATFLNKSMHHVPQMQSMQYVTPFI